MGDMELDMEGGKRIKRAANRKGKGKGKGSGGCNTCASLTKGGKRSRSASPTRGPCETKKPKRKLSPYNIFIKSAYARLKKLHPNASAPEIMKKAAAEWQSKK